MGAFLFTRGGRVRHRIHRASRHRRGRTHRDWPGEAAAHGADRGSSGGALAALRGGRESRHQPRDRARGAAQDARLDAAGRFELRVVGAERAQQDRSRPQQVGRGRRRQSLGNRSRRTEEDRSGKARVSEQESFISHLVELRQRLVRAVGAVLAIFVVLFIYPGSGLIYDLLALPLMNALPEGAKMIATGVITPFMVPVKVTALAGCRAALPYVLYQAWAFVAPGLYEHEKKLALPLIVASSVLFFIRSEERRVGKGCSARIHADDYKSREESE